jgi:hypothetical protein
MSLIAIDPPGTFCSYEALRDLVKKTKAKSFIDVGCCSGNFSKLLCSIGLRGAGDRRRHLRRRRGGCDQARFRHCTGRSVHRGGANTTGRGWRAVNQAYSIPFIRQQIDLPSALGPRFNPMRTSVNLLEYDVLTPQSVSAYYEARRVRQSQPPTG